jgi:DNA-binding protein Fis
VLAEVDGNKTKAAARLKISRRTLYNKLAEYDLL